MNGDSEKASDRLGQSFPPALLPGLPALGEVEDFLGALVIAPRPAGTWQQSGNPLLLEGLFGHIVSLAADPESFGHVADRAAVDPMAAQHLVLDLHAVARVEENCCAPVKASSRTLCGLGWSASAARSAAALGSSGRREAISVNDIKYTA